MGPPEAVADHLEARCSWQDNVRTAKFQVRCLKLNKILYRSVNV